MKLLASLLCILIPLISKADNRNTAFPNLSSVRQFLEFKEVPVGERIEILKQFQKIFSEFYAHGPHQLKRLGKEFNVPDRLEKLLLEAGSLSTEEFHYRLNRILLDVQDMHTNYLMPEPRQCYSVFLPVQFKLSYDESRRPIAIVSGIEKTLLPTPNLELGDTLVSYDNIGVGKAISTLAPLIRRSSPSSALRESISALSFRQLVSTEVPLENSVSLRLINRTTGKPYSLKLDWKVLANKVGNCDALVPKQVPFEKPIFQKPAPVTEGWINTAEPAFSYKWVNADGKKIAVVKITAMNKGVYGPSRTDDLVTMFDFFKRLLLVDLGEAEAYIIDVRGNGGGDPQLANGLANFFRKDQSNLKWRFVNSEVHKEMTQLPGPNNDFFGFAFYYEQTRNTFLKGKSYSTAVPIVPLDAPPIGKINYSHYANYDFTSVNKPVGIFINGSCYSACDMFVQAAKGTRAVLFGEDKTSGGALGVFTKWSSSFPLIPKKVAEKLGYKQLPPGIDCRVTYRQVVYDRVLGWETLEGIGVKADVFLPPSPDDELDGSTRQYVRISKKLLN